MIVTVRNFLEKHEQEQFGLLKELVLQPSFSRNKANVDRVGTIITRALAALPLAREEIEQSGTGNHLVFRSPACNARTKSILLVGHMDTVFPPESSFTDYREDKDKVYGPGVIDMKGGLVTAIFALKALHHQHLLTQIPITLICNGDEEIGSPTSTDLITSEARKALYSLVFECGGLNGEIVTGRKGKTGFTIKVTGQAGHAAFAREEKASAILELAHKTIAIERLNNPVRQLVVNVGTTEGGIGPNTIPDKAVAQIDSRYLTGEDGAECIAAARAIAEKCTVPGTTGSLTITSSRPPMEQSSGNRALYHHVEEIADQLNIKVNSELRSGVSDANTIAATGIPVVDGMGPIGDGDHSDREYMLRKSLPMKTLLTTVVIAKKWL